LKKVLFIGPIGKLNHPQGGDQYKNQLLLEALNNIEINVISVDTFNWYRRVSSIFTLLNVFFFKKFDIIVLSASSLSSYRVLNLFRRSGNKIVYFVIGGVLPHLIESKKLDTSVYKKLKKIVVEGNTMKDKLFQLGIKNVSVLPNFKIKQDYDNKVNSRNILKTVFVSRVIEEKGILKIVQAIQEINNQNEFKVSCDFYGPINSEWLAHFNSLNDDYIRYAGYLNFSKDSFNAYSALSEYDVFLFPTSWYGEGFPGVFLDAFMVGLPIICSDWNMNSEIVHNGYNGLVLKENTVEELRLAIQKLMSDTGLLKQLSINSKASFDNYDLKVAQNKILELIS
jgi:glycosyltransferase involved in cell wall biosynthesis